MSSETAVGTAVAPDIVDGLFKHPGGELCFRLFNNQVCIRISEEILAGKTYPEVPFLHDVHTILDIGANIGAASVWLGTTYAGATVYALEPGSQQFSLLQENVKPLNNVRPFPFGLFSSNKTVPLYRGGNDSVECSVVPSGRTTADSEDILLRCVPEFLSDEGITQIDILKLDTEGCEVPILLSLGKYLPSIKLVYVEYHSERDRRLIDQIFADSHVLWRAHTNLAFRGEFCYLRRDLLPPEKEMHSCEIQAAPD
jgi:FkbM family methyltransferase